MENSEESSGPQACHCFAARKLARHVSKLYERHMAKANITNTQFSILVFLQQEQSMTTSELAAAMAMDRTTLIRALKPLQNAALVGSEPAVGNGRQLAFSVTPDGLQKLSEAAPLWIAAQHEFETQMGHQQARHLRKQLQAVTA